LVMNLSAVFTIPIACWFQPDAPLMFFWLISVYFIVEVLSITHEGREKLNTGRIYLLWLLVGICMGLATLSKYHVIFLFLGAFIFISTNKNQRHWLRHPGPYMAMLITLLIAFPVLYWNYQNNWVSFVFQGSRAGSSGGIHPDWFLRSIGGQALWLLPWFWIPLMVQLYRSFKLRKQSQSYSFLFWTAILPLGFFTVVTLWSDLQYHFHWQAPGYLMLFMPLGFSISQHLNDPIRVRRTKNWLIFSACFTVITIGALTLHEVTGFWQSYGPKWAVSLGGDTVDPTIQGIDYDDVLTRFEKEGWINNPQIFAGTTRWWLNGKVDWALKGKKDIVCFNNDPRNIAFLIDPNKLVGQDAVVLDQFSPVSVKNDVTPFFDSVKQLPDIAIMRNGRDEMHLHVYYCTRFHVPAKPREDLPLYHQLTGRVPFGK
jgi:Dolichyl-phosphate-mannose-protein mannosyltransferase